jgi:Heterokaryon incompatibility protein (HET)
MSSSQWIPSRLISVGSAGEEYLRICTRDDVPAGRGYMTLSHCWGKLNILKLTVENLSQLLKSIPFTELPKTFQDAISITRALGIQYLWIDSLCILQDSEDDWRRESAMMGDVYSNSFCSIAATKAKDGSVGCFGNRDVFEAIPLIIKPAAGSPALQSRLTDGDEYPEYHFLSDDLVNQAITYSPLGCRAWFFQERLLSPRILHFSAHQMVFECPKAVACERYPAGVSVMPGKEHLKQSVSITSETLAQLSSDQWPELHLIWEEIVKTYSRMSLTYVKDKLIAISGIAQRMSGSFKCNYLAELWEERLLEQLL